MHHDELFARTAGQPGVFAMGQLSAALLARLSREWLGADALRALSVRFTAKLWPGDVLLLRGELTEVITSGQEACWHCQLSATRAGDGDIVARGELVARAPEAIQP
jgi:acyl dehydratase